MRNNVFYVDFQGEKNKRKGYYSTALIGLIKIELR